MKYYDLKEGRYKKGKLTEDEMWEAFHWLFSGKSLNDSSYKFIFLKSIIDCIDKKEANSKLSFDCLFEEFTKIAWNLITKYRIPQKIRSTGKKATLLEQDINDFMESYACKEFVLASEIDRRKWIELVNKVKRDCNRYVIGALYGDMKELLYSFSKKEQWVEVNPQMERFIKEHKSIIEGLNYYKWASFYEKINSKEDSKRIVEMFGSGLQRRKNESVYRAILAYEFERETPETNLNTVELLFMAEGMSENEEISKDSIEEELFQEYDNMKHYLSDPIALIDKLKKEKGISG